MSRHLVTTYDGPFLCNNGRDGIWTYDPAHATCVECLRTALLAASPRETAPAAAPHNPQSEE